MSRAAADTTWKLSSSHSAAGDTASWRASSASCGVDVAKRPHVVLEPAEVRAGVAVAARRDREQRREPARVLLEHLDAQQLDIAARDPGNCELLTHAVSIDDDSFHTVAELESLSANSQPRCASASVAALTRPRRRWQRASLARLTAAPIKKRASAAVNRPRVRSHARDRSGNLRDTRPRMRSGLTPHLLAQPVLFHRAIPWRSSRRCLNSPPSFTTTMAAASS